MDHQEALALLPAYLDQELGITDMLAVERHLESCAECQHAHREQSEISMRLKNAAVRFEAPPRLVERIRSALPREGEASPIFKRSYFNWFNAGATVAALLAMMWSVGLFLNLPSNQDRLADELMSSHVRSLQVDHLADVTSSDRHTVKPWFSGKLNFSPQVVDLAAQSFPLVGGRLDYIDGHSVAVLIYRHNLHPINVYVWPATGKEASLQSQDRHGYHFLHWNMDGMVYWVVSDVAANDLKDFADKLRSAVRQ